MKNKIPGHILVIFGATGDLAKRSIIPALFNLHRKGGLHKNSIIVATGRKDYTKKEYHKSIETGKYIKNKDEDKIGEFLDLIIYHKIDIEKGDFCELEHFLVKLDKKHKCGGNKIFYFATPPTLFSKITRWIKSCGIQKNKGFQRVVYEKPFGYDLASAEKLNNTLKSIFPEKDIFRIDHFLGKELVQSIMVLRFANSLFEQIWNNKFIDYVQISIPESLGVGTRAGYYEKTGVIRDMVQNHLLQILSLTAMEAPKSMSADDIRDEKVKVLQKLKKVKKEEVVVGQYTSGVIDDKRVLGYAQEKGILKNSKTPTFVQIKAYIDNPRWKDVPFYLMTGKRLKGNEREVNIVLKDVVCRLYFGKKCEHNIISIRIQPDEGIAVRFNAKKHGSIDITPQSMEFCHACEFGTATPTAYEKLLSDAMAGDQTLFTRWDEVKYAWKFTDPLIKEAGKNKLYFYKAGVGIPKEAEEMLKRDDREFVKVERKSTS